MGLYPYSVNDPHCCGGRHNDTPCETHERYVPTCGCGWCSSIRAEVARLTRSTP